METTAPQGRRIVVVDLENLLGCAPHIASDACWALALTRVLTRVRFDHDVDQLVVGVGPDWVFTARDLAPFARIVSLAGRDGADRALCASLEDVDYLRERYRAVVVASGDHAFVRPVRRLVATGVDVTVAALPLQASAELLYYATEVDWLERPARVLGEDAYVSTAEGMGRVATARGIRRALALAA